MAVNATLPGKSAGDDDWLICEGCGRTDLATSPDETSPEFCECCDTVRCEPCWFATHVYFMS